MRIQHSSDKCPKAAVSVSEMASLCGLSRARFYELVSQLIMPPPCYDLRSRRPLYPRELQEVCLDVRRTNTAIDGRYVVFNNRRSEPSNKERVGCTPSRSRPVASPTPPARDPQAVEVVEGLRSLGVTAAEAAIRESITTCYPDGLPIGQIDVAIKTVFRHLGRRDAA